MARLISALLLSFGALLLPCNAVAQGTSPRVVAFAQDTLSNDFRLAQVNEVRDAVAKEPGLQFVYSDAEGKTALLIRQMEQFISQKVDVLILGTNDERAVVPFALLGKDKRCIYVFGGNAESIRHSSFEGNVADMALRTAQEMGAKLYVEDGIAKCCIGEQCAFGESFVQALMRAVILDDTNRTPP